MSPHRRYLLSAASTGLLIVFLSAFAIPAQASIAVNIGNLDLPVGGTGDVSVTISSDNGMDVLDVFGAVFMITTSGSTRLQFVSLPTDPQLFDPSYLFYGDSAGALAPPVGVVNSPYDTYIGGDGTLSHLGVVVPMTNPPLDKLLVTLQVMADPTNPPIAGDKFTISLVTSDPSTFFYDPSYADIPFTSSSGEVNVIPEPSSLVVFVGLSISFALISWRRFR